MDQKSVGARVIFEQIDDLFMEHVGPIASVLCSEAFDQWLAALKLHEEKPTLRNVAGYVSLLVEHIDNDKHRQQFLNDVYSIQALSHYRKFY